MILFPNCKINLGLNVLRKRSDGYHDIETIFYPIPINDILEITENKDPDRPNNAVFSMSGLTIEGDNASNLCAKAHRVLKKNIPGLPPVKMHLHKVIPSGAGMGGGSSDAAFTFKIINSIFNLGLTTQELIDYSLQVGSDCPFFMINKPCFASGRGEFMEEIGLDLSGYKFIIVNPGIHIDTGRSFLNIRPGQPERPLKEIINTPVERWKDHLYNDFEKNAFKEHPAIVDIKDQLYIAGAIYASMSGSGSTVYGIFAKDAKPALSFPEQYFVRELVS